LPQQLDKLLIATQLYARKDFDWKLFHLSIKAIGQISNQKESVRLPSFWQKTTLYYQGGFIKGRLKAQMGFDLVYNTNYKANNYNPALMEFYVQNQEKIAFYPVLDVFSIFK
jgi:phage tail tube protein FII